MCRRIDPEGYGHANARVTGDAILESSPISYDFRGVRFNNIFLVGEAAGLASGLSGEGIYQSLVSGQEVARMILDPDYNPCFPQVRSPVQQDPEQVYASAVPGRNFQGFIHRIDPPADE